MLSRCRSWSLIAAGICFAPLAGLAAEPSRDELTRQFTEVVRPFLVTHCVGCHNADKPEAELDLSGDRTAADVVRRHQTWAIVRERLEAREMPPKEAKTQPTDEQRRRVIEWIQNLRRDEARRHAGDPGPVIARRLNNAEYNHSIRDLTGIDLRPAQEFPIDPANEAGFDNSGESLTMSPALLQKYLEAARRVAEHLVLTPDGIAFAPHPVMTDTDRDKYCVKRIVEFYQRQPTDLAAYFYAAWRYWHREPTTTLADIANAEHVSEKYLTRIWHALAETPETVGPLAKLQAKWTALPAPSATNRDDVRKRCEQLRDDVLRLRRRLEFEFPNLDAAGVHKGSQTFVLWKNRQYASHRRLANLKALKTASDDEADAELVVPADPPDRARYEAAFARFCDLFPDAFYIAERGRDYLGKSRDQQEKGRLLSAGFHSMTGYFRDDGPLYDLILDESQQAELDRLWRELDFVTSAPMRQYEGFLWFERTDSRYLRDESFDFARPENKAALSQASIERLGQLYREKAVNGGAEGTPVEAIDDYFRDINAQIRWVEQARIAAEPRHITALVEFAERAYRRPLTDAERAELPAFYQALRTKDGLSHEEAVQDGLVSILMSPHFCYRVDLVASETGRRALTDHELASRLSYFLWASPPDRELRTLAEAGTLHQPEVLLAQIRRMVRDDKLRGLAVEFGGNWLDFRQFENHNAVDRDRFPSFTNELRQAMFEEPIRFLVDLFRENRSVLECLDGTHTFVNPVLAKHYGIDIGDRADNDWVRVQMPSDRQRGGLMPMAVFLTQNAPGLRTSPVKRGYWVARRLLGERIPPPPPTVPELPADEAALGELTVRDVLARHREHASCAACHERFDALGLAFEGFGPIGELRTVDLGGRKIDASAIFPGGMDGTGLDGLRRYLRDRRQAEFLENLCQKLLSYALGRTLLPSDEELVATMRSHLAANEFRAVGLLETIVQSPQFRTKRGREETTE